MAVRSTEEIMEMVRTRVGDDTSDESLSFIEDISDTLESFNQADADKKEWEDKEREWEEKYNSLDTEWREKYKKRFFEGRDDHEVIVDEKVTKEEQKEKTSYDELFEEG